MRGSDPPARGQVLPAGGETHLIIGRRNFSAAWLKDNHPAVSEKILSLWGAPPALVQSRVEAARKASVVACAREESSRRGEGGGQGQDEGQAQDIEAGTAGRLGSAGAAAGKAGSAPGRVPPHHNRAEVHAEQAVGGRAAAPPPPPPPPTVAANAQPQYNTKTKAWRWKGTDGSIYSADGSRIQ